MIKRLVVSICLLMLAVSGAAQAELFNKDPNASVQTFKIGALAGIRLNASGVGTAWLSADHQTLHIGEAVWSTTSYGPGTSLYTGVPIIWHQVIIGKNASGTIAVPSVTSWQNPIGPGLGGSTEQTGMGGGWNGSNALVVHQPASGTARTGLDLNQAGSTVEDAILFAGVLTINVTFGRFWVGSHDMTNISTNLISLPNRIPPVQGAGFSLNPESTEEVRTMTTGGNFITSYPSNTIQLIHTIAIAGSWDVTSSGGTGTITVVTPLRVDTNGLVGPPGSAGRVPAMGRSKFSFVPEPGAVVLLVGGALGLFFLGRRKLRSR